jgi:hypothetical protein
VTTADAIVPRGAAGRTAPWLADCALAAAVALLALVLHAHAGFPTLAAAHGDNDSLLRLVQVRDLLAGQGWFDLHQYRMGPAGGVVMHWSRLVDAPIAATMLAASALTGSAATGEVAALVAWPLFLMAGALFLMLRIARAIGGDFSVLPALTIGGAALHFTGIFVPGSIDHHNVQLVLALAVLAALSLGRGFVSGLVAGSAAALMLAVGMETLPYVAVAGMAVALAYLLQGREQAKKSAGYGTGFSAVGAAAFAATVPPGSWFAAQCDAYSIPQFAIAAIAGAGLAAICFIPLFVGGFRQRLTALTVLGAATVAIVAGFFPQCLADPYAGLDPLFQEFWMRGITEAQPLRTVLANNWAMAASYYATPLIGLAVLGWHLRKYRPELAAIFVGAFLATAFAVSVWQVRGAMFSIPLAAIPLAAWVGGFRRSAAAAAGSGQTVKMTLAWLVSLNVAWSASANAAANALGAPVSPAARDATGTCDNDADYAALAAEPATTVLAISNIGAPILANTHHRALAGPYHRNVVGDLLMLKGFTGSSDEARAIVNASSIGLIAVCRGNDETSALVERSPGGFMAALVSGYPPEWLEKLPQAAGEPLEVYRVAQSR